MDTPLALGTGDIVKFGKDQQILITGQAAIG